MVNITEDDVGSLWLTRQGDVVRITAVSPNFADDEDWRDEAVVFEIVTPTSKPYDKSWAYTVGMNSSNTLNGQFIQGDGDCPMDLVSPLEFKECPW